MICGMLVRSSWVFLVTCFALIFCGMDICICNKVHVCVIHLLFLLYRVYSFGTGKMLKDFISISHLLQLYQFFSKHVFNLGFSPLIQRPKKKIQIKTLHCELHRNKQDNKIRKQPAAFGQHFGRGYKDTMHTFSEYNAYLFSLLTMYSQ